MKPSALPILFFNKAKIFSVLALFFFHCSPVSADSPTYLLTPGDKLRFEVVGEEETRGEHRIEGDGTVNLPYIGPVMVAGISLRQAEDRARQAYLEGDIYVRLQVIMEITAYSPKEATVSGIVRRPGKIRFPDGVNSLPIMEVITKAGGFGNTARTRDIRITRANPSEGDDPSVSVNVDRILSGRSDEPDFPVFPGDIIFVPERLL